MSDAGKTQDNVKGLRQKIKSFPKIIKLLCVSILFLLLALLVIKKLTGLPVDVGKDKKSDLVPVKSEDWVKLAIPQRKPPFFTLSTIKQRKFGILPDEKFVLKTKESLDQKFIKNNLESSAPLVVNSAGSKTYEIKPVSNIGLDQVVKLKLNVEGKENNDTVFDRDYSWAFQTQGKFRVVSSIPGNEQVNVPLNTGIELVFSQDDYQNPDDYLQINPSIKFRTERHGETLAIIPLDPLQEKTVYTITLKKGLNLESRDDPISSDFQFSFQTKEKKEKKKKPRFSFNKNFYQVTPEDKFQAKVYTANWNEENKIKADIYRFYTPEEFISSRDKIDEIQTSWKKYYPGDALVDVDKLNKIMTVDLEVHKEDNLSYIEFPEPLSRGFYIAEMSNSDEKRKVEQIWIQSTSLTGYVSVGKEQTLIWANTSGVGPVNGAQIRLAGLGELARTSDNGLAVFNTPSSLIGEKIKYLKLVSGEASLYLKVADLRYRSNPGKVTPDDYWSYFYHERTIYKPTDKIDFYGVVKKRSTGSPPANLTAEFYQGYYRDYSYRYYNRYRNSDEDKDEPEPMFTKTLTPSDDGSFTENFEFENLPSGSYHIKIVADGVEVVVDSFSIGDYTKPEIKIEVVGDKKAVFADQKVNFTATAKFYDNTPVVDTPLSVHESVGGKSKEIKTGLNGQISYEYQSKYNESYDHYPRYEHITVKPAVSQEANVEGHATVKVFGSRLMIRSESNQDGNKAKFTAEVNNVDLSKINSEEGSDYKGSPASNQEVKLNLTKKWYEKIEKGTYYDFVEKVTRKSYTYKLHKDKIDTKTLKTDINGRIEYEFEMEDGKSYELEAVTYDKNGRPDKTKKYYYSSRYRRDQSRTSGYPTLNTNKDKNIYSLGEPVNLSVNLNDEIYPDNDQNKFLFIFAKNGRQDTIIKDSPSYSFDFSKKHIPNVSLGGVIFTGRYYSKILNYPYAWHPYSHNTFNGINIAYDKKDSQVDLNIDTSQSSTKPGGRGKIIVKAEKDGQPLANASINLTLVDQALAAIGFVNEPSILTNLYKRVPSKIYYTYHTHEPALPDYDQPQAEYGGGGGARELFKDTAYFETLKTDENGQAEFEFDLPDNITTWLIYAQAVDNQINAGWKESQLTVTKNFFVTSQFPSEYLSEEKPVLTGGSYGRGLDKNDRVDFEALFNSGDNLLSQSSKTTVAFKNISFDFPRLQLGEYDVILLGQSGTKKDGLKLPVKVIDSRFSLENYTRQKLNKGDVQTSAEVTTALQSEPVTMVISDQGKGIYYRDLKRFCYTASNRLEKQLAGIAATKILEANFDDQCKKAYQGISLFQTNDGGLSQVNWGGSNLETTAWAVNLDPEPFDRKALIEYFQEVLNDPKIGTKSEVLASWGLTKLGHPQIVRLNLLKEKAAGFNEKVILGLAFASIGDTEKALNLYYDILADYAYKAEPYIRIENPDEDEETKYILSTSHALLLGELTDPEYNEGLGKYIKNFRSRSENLVIDLSEMAYIEDQINKLPDEDTQIYFKVSNIEETKELTKGKSITYDLSPEKINNFYLEVLKGKAETYMSYYIGKDTFRELSQDDRLKITRKIEKVKGSGNEIKAGDILKVRIDFDLNKDVSPPGGYEITDYVPSGLKYISNPYLFGLDADGWVRHNDQVIKYYFSNTPWWRDHGRKHFTYYVRAGSVGTYLAEPAVIQSQKELKLFKSTSEKKIEVNQTNRE